MKNERKSGNFSDEGFLYVETQTDGSQSNHSSLNAADSEATDGNLDSAAKDSKEAERKIEKLLKFVADGDIQMVFAHFNVVKIVASTLLNYLLC